jgi:hypothetical protein
MEAIRDPLDRPSHAGTGAKALAECAGQVASLEREVCRRTSPRAGIVRNPSRPSLGKRRTRGLNPGAPRIQGYGRIKLNPPCSSTCYDLGECAIGELLRMDDKETAPRLYAPRGTVCAHSDSALNATLIASGILSVDPGKT